MHEPHLVAWTRPNDPEHAGMPWDLAYLDATLPRLLADHALEPLPVRLDTSEGILARLSGYDGRVIVDREELAIARELGAGALRTYTLHIVAQLFELATTEAN